MATLFLAILFPRVVPAARRGPECTNLTHPIGGNNRSVLAQTGSKGEAIELDLNLEETTIRAGDPLKIQLTFVNQDIGPVILYLMEREPILTRTNPATGLSIPSVTFLITRVTETAPLIDQIGTALNLNQPTQFDYNDLHLLTSRSRCTESFTVSGSKLQQIGVQPGEYRIQAFYRNDSAGTLPLPDFGTPTATPAYNDQGVWVGEISSEEVRFTVVVPGQP